MNKILVMWSVLLFCFLPIAHAFELNPSFFTGKELDDTGLLYYGARYYNPLHARFTQPDTIIADVYDPQNLNKYSYVLNNPYKYTDPSGEFVWFAIAAIAIIAAEIASIAAPYLAAYTVQEEAEDVDHAITAPTPENMALAGLSVYDAATPGLPEGKAAKAAGKGIVKSVSKVSDSDAYKKLNNALGEAFKKTGYERSQFKETKYVKDKWGKTHPVEWQLTEGKDKGLTISIDTADKTKGPHIGIDQPGKRKNKPREHHFLDFIPPYFRLWKYKE